MSFRRCQTFYSGSFSPIFLVQMVKDKDSGALVPTALCSSESVLPDSDLFELENLLAAKIPLQQVNSKLVGGASIDLQKLAASRMPKTAVVNDKETDTNPKNGVNNE